jgi:tRNA pseudouridine55 synthase
VVQWVRRALGVRSAGHTGTLDPFATGLLVVLVGRATRLARFLEAQPKTYLATARLGIRTSTDDFTGAQIRPEMPGSLPEDLVRRTLLGFGGSQAQIPPQFSAKHVAGERSYRKARRGEAVELAEVPITVHEVSLIEYRPPELAFRVTVSPGTYVRAIARDLGERLGCGAHLNRLRRVAIGSLRVEDAVPLERLSPAALLKPRQVLSHLPSVDLDESARRDIVHGRAVVDRGAAGQRDSGAAVALLAQGELVAVARIGDGMLYPTVVLEDPEAV